MSTDDANTATDADRKVLGSEDVDDTSTRWVDLDHADGSVEVEEVPIMALIRDLQRHNVAFLLDADNKEQAEKGMQKALANGDWSDFMDSVMVDRIVQPDVFWDDPADGDVDLAGIHPEDITNIVAGMAGVDPDSVDIDGESFPR